jgi:hypothetical protein
MASFVSAVKQDEEDALAQKETGNDQSKCKGRARLFLKNAG